ncbi:methionyl-tRNA formyltransferase [Agilicoccus flavus]|uniref:methionyl-tRNA formyltransferase n=1 Tax=Agilicoccus flavus TaxID=2775968 RepID=UPI001CF61EE3|nr:methionyl-tRNA formyltransferase [Agilicoccus flavus]
MRVVFAGTPDVALPSLRALLDSGHDVLAVLTRPDAPAGRGRTLLPSPVKVAALAAGVEVLTPARPSDPAFLDRLRELAPDACPIVAYGGLIRPEALAIPRRGWVNLHFSLLPAWRGAAPVQRALIAGEEVTGATTFLLEEGLDTGPVLARHEVAVGARETAGDLLARLAVEGAPLLVDSLDGLADGSIVPRPQRADGVTHAPKLTADDARVRWDEPADALGALVRGCTPAPGAWTTHRGERIKLGPVTPAPGTPTGSSGASAPPTHLAPGEIEPRKNTVWVGTGTAAVELGTVQAPGKKPMSAADWARGRRVGAGERFEA